MSLFQTTLEEDIALLKKWKDSYYNGQPEVSDEVYDLKEEEVSARIKAEAPDHPFLQEVGAPVDGVWPKFTHPTVMGSLAKARSDKLEEDLENWIKDKENNFHLTEKIDGASVIAVYEKGNLKTLATRGDGAVGDDITLNAADFNNFPLSLKEPITCTLRGEATIRLSDFAKCGAGFKNPRNAASGKLRDTKCDDLKKCITVFWFEVISCENRAFQTWEEQNDFFNSLDLTVPNNWSNINYEELLRIYKAYVADVRTSLDYWIDGLVCRVMDIRTYNDLGSVGNRPKGAIALKFPSVAKETTIVGLEINRGLQGRFTPVAIITPVEIDGTLITRATLNNYDWIAEKELYIGDTVEIVKGGDIIPKIIKKIANGGNRTPIPTPKDCDACGKPLQKFGAYLECDNEECEGQAYGSMLKWITVLDIRGIGPAHIKNLIKSNITDMVKLYEASQDDLTEAIGSAVLSKKMFKALKDRQTMSLAIFLSALNISSLGLTNGQRLASHFKNLDALLESGKEDLVRIDGIAETNAVKIWEGLQNKKDLIQKLTTILTIKGAIEDGKLSGLSFCITGALPSGRNRKQLVELIEANGGEVKNDVGKGLSYLITDEPNSGSSKNLKADKHGVKKISEADFDKML